MYKRQGKYLDKDGKPTLVRKEVKYVRAIPGHNLTIGALGVFILWFLSLIHIFRS